MRGVTVLHAATAGGGGGLWNGGGGGAPRAYASGHAHLDGVRELCKTLCTWDGVATGIVHVGGGSRGGLRKSEAGVCCGRASGEAVGGARAPRARAGVHNTKQPAEWYSRCAPLSEENACGVAKIGRGAVVHRAGCGAPRRALRGASHLRTPGGTPGQLEAKQEAPGSSSRRCDENGTQVSGD